jgi:hypothetical protein
MGYAPFNTQTGVGEPIIGYFTECDHGQFFEYSLNSDLVLAPPAHGGKNMTFPHKVWVGPLAEYRFAKVMKTCIHIITNETEFGWVVEKWNIKKHRIL